MMNQRVVPSPDGITEKPLAKKQKSSRNLFQTQNSNRPRQYEKKRKKRLDEEFNNKSTYLFILILGLVLIIGGSAMTWWGTQSEVKDLLLLGPGCIVIGFLFAIVGIVFGARALYRLHQRQKVEISETTAGDISFLKFEYHIPDTGVPEKETPGDSTLYGTDDLARARRASMITQQAKTISGQEIDFSAPIHVEGAYPHTAQFYFNVPNELAAPVVALPRSNNTQEVIGPTCEAATHSQLTMDKLREELPPITDDENGLPETENVRDGAAKIRPDSGFVPSTPDTLDTVLADDM